ncbi:heavy-metal-associated domain-containing protein [Polaromonas sp. P1(28)-13]|nr:heavy-metal-associated domain-containing protein [Polaromonas sp. P1(28)-13]
MQALQALTGVSGVEVDLQSGHVRVSGEFLQSSDPLVSALTAAGYPAKLATSSLSISPSKKKLVAALAAAAEAAAAVDNGLALIGT